MFRFFTYNHPFTYLILVMIAVALRLPSFHSGYIGTDEACYLTAAERLADGGTQYIDSWDNKPPVIVWFYWIFVEVFGSGALTAIRVFTVAYLVATAILMNQIISSQRIIQRFSLFPAFIFLVLASVPWYAQELNAEMLMLLPVCGAFYQLIRIEERATENNSYLFYAGLMLGLSVMIKYQAIFLFGGLAIAYLTVYSPRMVELVSLVAGLLVSIAAILLMVYFSGAMGEFWDIGVLYNLDYIAVGANPGEEVTPLQNIVQYLLLWGAFLFTGMVAVIHFRINYFKNAIRLRKTESVIFLWLMAALITIASGFGRMYLHYFIMLAPPLTVYVARFFDMQFRGWIKFVALISAFAFPVFTYFAFLVSAFPNTFSFVDPYLNATPVNTNEFFADPYFETTGLGWIQGHRMRLNQPDPLERYIDKSKVKNGVLILDFLPEHYVRLKVRCATRYSNFSIAWYKMQFLGHNKDRTLFSSWETDAEVFAAFTEEMPEYIVDPHGIFPEMQVHFPLLFGDFKSLPLTYYRPGDGRYAIYSRLP